jgi:hypothetical protein
LIELTGFVIVGKYVSGLQRLVRFEFNEIHIEMSWVMDWEVGTWEFESSEVLFRIVGGFLNLLICVGHVDEGTLVIIVGIPFG